MNAHDIGDLVRISTTFSVAGVATDPTAVSLTVTDPSGTATTYTYAGAQVVKTAAGAYRYDLSVAAAGVYTYRWVGTGVAEGADSGQFMVKTALPPGTLYCSIVELKDELGPITDTLDDAALERIIAAVSRQLDVYCGRRFYAATQTRYFTATCSDHVWVDDMLSVTTLKTDTDGDRVYETTWTTSDYQLEPINAQLESQPLPYERICTKPLGSHSFPTGEHDIQVVGSFGYATTTPSTIKLACLRQCALETMARTAPGGVNSVGDAAMPMRAGGLHPFVRTMLNPFRRGGAGIVAV